MVPVEGAGFKPVHMVWLRAGTVHQSGIFDLYSAIFVLHGRKYVPVTAGKASF